MGEIITSIKQKGLALTVNGLGGDGSILIGGRLDGSTKRAGPFAIIRPGDPRPVITSAPRVSATLGQPFRLQLTATNNPTSFAYFDQVDGFPQSLPEGLTLDSQTGVIIGTPTKAGTSRLYVHALNGLGDVSPLESILSITVST